MKRAIVIGASSGIGREVSRLLIKDGWNLGVMARRTELLMSLRAECPERVCAMTADVTAADAIEKFRELINDTGGMDLFFYAAGTGRYGVCVDAEVEMRTVRTNVMAFTRMIDEAYAYMAVNNGGHIAVISSIAGTKGLGAAPAYSASKAYQSMYIQALEQQARMLRLPIIFTDIRPGFVDTPLLAGSKYPMLMDVRDVAGDIINAVAKKRHVRVIDWRYRILTAAWRMLPSSLWRRMTWVR